MVNNWLTSHGKAATSKSSEAQVTALTGGSSNYIQTILKATGTYQTGTPQLRVAPSPQLRVAESPSVKMSQKDDDEKPSVGTDIENFIARVYE